MTVSLVLFSNNPKGCNLIEFPVIADIWGSKNFLVQGGDGRLYCVKIVLYEIEENKQIVFAPPVSTLNILGEWELSGVWYVNLHQKNGITNGFYLGYVQPHYQYQKYLMLDDSISPAKYTYEPSEENYNKYKFFVLETESIADLDPKLNNIMLVSNEGFKIVDLEAIMVNAPGGVDQLITTNSNVILTSYTGGHFYLPIALVGPKFLEWSSSRQFSFLQWCSFLALPVCPFYKELVPNHSPTKVEAWEMVIMKELAVLLGYNTLELEKPSVTHNDHNAIFPLHGFQLIIRWVVAAFPHTATTWLRKSDIPLFSILDLDLGLASMAEFAHSTLGQCLDEKNFEDGKAYIKDKVDTEPSLTGFFNERSTNMEQTGKLIKKVLLKFLDNPRQKLEYYLEIWNSKDSTGYLNENFSDVWFRVEHAKVIGDQTVKNYPLYRQGNLVYFIRVAETCIEEDLMWRGINKITKNTTIIEDEVSTNYPKQPFDVVFEICQKELAKPGVY